MMQYMAREKLFYTLNLGQATVRHAGAAAAAGRAAIAPQAGARSCCGGGCISPARLLILIGVLAMRWNVVIGGQLFSKSLRGVMSYKMEFAGLEGWFMGGVLLVPAVRHPDRDGEAVPVPKDSPSDC